MEPSTLLFVAGASPQIITETVYALAQNGVRGGKVVVLTTVPGRAGILRQVLKRGGAWSQLRRHCGGARGFTFDAESVEVLRDANNSPLEDVRSDADNIAAADQIVRRVAQLTREGCPPLHASIAGGRKTMGYLLATAMMLCGRREDELSHVLVRPAALEGTDFYFPPRRLTGTLAYRRPDKSIVRVHAQDVEVDLATLPFLRLRAVRNPELIRRLPFSELVAQCQADLNALASPELQLLPDGSSLLCSGREVRLSDVRFAIYELLAVRRRNGCGRTDCPGCPRCFVSAEELRTSVPAQLRSRLQVRESHGVSAAAWTAANFRSERTKINAALQKVLRGASAPYEISVVGERGARLYGLGLDPGCIHVEQ